MVGSGRHARIVLALHLALLVTGSYAQEPVPRDFCSPADCAPAHDCCSDDVFRIELVAGSGLEGRFETRVVLDARTDGIVGWTLAVRHDPGALLVEDVSSLDADFVEFVSSGFHLTDVAFRGDVETGIGQSVILSFVQNIVLPVRDGVGLLTASYSVKDDGGVTTDLQFASDELSMRPGNPPLELALATGRRRVGPARIVDLRLDLGEVDERGFVRGDCNGDSRVQGQTSDAIFVLNYNFLAGPAPPCLAACDANGDGRVEGQVGDAVFLLNFNFLAGPPPSAPFPDCGPPTEPDEALGCEAGSCPVD